MSDCVPVSMVKYADDADLDVDYEGHDPTVENHDEVEKIPVVRGMARESAEEYGMDIVEPGDPLWEPGFESMDIGDKIVTGDPYV